MRVGGGGYCASCVWVGFAANHMLAAGLGQCVLTPIHGDIGIKLTILG